MESTLSRGWTLTSFRPSPALTPYFKLYNIGKVLSSNDLTPVFYPPSGYTRIILSYQKALPSRIYGKSVSTFKAAIVGQYFNYAEVSFTRSLQMINILVKPSAFYKVFGFDMQGLTNTIMDAQDVFGNSIITLLEHLAEADSDEQRILKVENYFLSKFKVHKYQAHVADDVISLMLERKGNIRMIEISDYFNCSLRFLEKKFKTSIGISPKYMARIIQFNNALAIMKSEENVRWSDLVVRLGYYDQAHLTNTFKEFTGKTLVQYHSANNAITESHLTSETEARYR
jgi:AraC-like DNA-binding protein